MSQQKKIHNRFDEYEISAMFTESADALLSKKYEKQYRLFFWKCVIGPLLAFNLYFSHWGPIPWPENRWIVFASVIIYLLGSMIYSKLCVISPSEGSMIGEYLVENVKKIFLLKICKDHNQYNLEIVDSATKKVEKIKAFMYYEYFTSQGVFLETQYQKHVEAFLVAK